MKAVTFGAAALVLASSAAANEPSGVHSGLDALAEHKIIRCQLVGSGIYFAFKIGPDRELTPVQFHDDIQIRSFSAGTVYVYPDRVMVLSKLQLTVVEESGSTQAECDVVGMELRLLLQALSRPED